MKKFLVIVFVLFLIPFVSAQTYHTTLLTVGEGIDEQIGGTADVYLEVKQGTGRVFIDTFPITKTDTQFSTRYAKEIACDFLQKDCNNYDFFYTIRSGSTIVGGPSAGAAITILTIAALDNQPINQEVAMTGTINSGGLIGSVSGIIPKVTAAKQQGFHTVIVPKLSSLGLEQFKEDFENVTSINLSQEYDELLLENISSKDFTIIQATDLYEALPYFLDKTYKEPSAQLIIPDSYKETMKKVSRLLCERREELLEKNPQYEYNESLRNESYELNERIVLAVAQEKYYSAASFCFGHNIELQREMLKDLRQGALRQQYFATVHALEQFETYLEQQNITTIGDVETYAIVRERFLEAQTLLADINQSNVSSNELAYIIERAYSATIWAEFFAMQSQEFTINEEHLQHACLSKLAEAEERISYVENTASKEIIAQGREDLQIAKSDEREKEYALCLFKASKAKAQASILLSAIAITEPKLDDLIEQKTHAVERVLSRQAELGLFPIMGFSYYEYAQSLAQDSSFTAVTFLEYSLELSNLQLYFPKEQKTTIPSFPMFTRDQWIAFGGGFIAGVICIFLLFLTRKN